MDDSYKDYPAAAKANAKKAISWKEEYGRDVVKGGTAVGWARAHQLAKGEALSRDVVSRMAQFNRHRKNSKIAPEFKDEPWRDNGLVAWLIWGGDEGVDWAMKKMDQIRKEEANESVKRVKLFEEFINEIASGYDLVIKNIEDNSYIVRATYNGKQVGELHFIKSRSKSVLMAGSLSVDPNHRRKGIASSMYEFAEKELGMKFARSEDVLTPDGKLLWNNPNRKFGLN